MTIIVILLICCIFCCVSFVFFFKQKTAYELRISDWSSDVCSSDLEGEIAGPEAQRQVVDAEEGAAEGRQRALQMAHVALLVDHQPQIGRASCRERVCQYV